MRTKLDKSTMVLVLIAVLGIVFSLFSLWQISRQSDSRSDKDKIAVVVQAEKDTRLKRYGSINWYNASVNLDCYDDDLVFTGNDSYAVIEFTDGGKITLLPNTLISLSKGHVSLSSGSIEITQTQGSLSVESFGERFVVKKDESLRIQNTSEQKKIVPLGTNPSPLQNNRLLKEFLVLPDLKLAAPIDGDRIPKYRDLQLRLAWKTPTEDSRFKIEFSADAEFSSVIHSEETSSREIRLGGAILPSGRIHWRVKDLKHRQESKSTFVLVDIPEVNLLNPALDSKISLKKIKSDGLLFNWDNPLKLKQRVQLALDPDFKKVIHDYEGSDAQRKIPLVEKGSYYWRVGHITPNKLTIWSKLSRFELIPEIVITPIIFKPFARTMDFALTEEYKLDIQDLNECQEFVFTVFKGSKIVLQRTSPFPMIILKALENGDYSISVKGKLKEGITTQATTESFFVRNSPPVKAPKIKNKKKVKLLVRLLEEISDFFIPSAHASMDKFYPLTWEGSKGATYEIEIVQGEQKEILVKKELTSPKYSFHIQQPGKYYWRVRMKEKDRWGNFTEYFVIEAADKVTWLKEPLMFSPTDNTSIRTNAPKGKITFQWKEPFKDVTYVLELFRDDAKEPFKTLEVKGGSKTLEIENLPQQLKWRVFAKSQYQNTSPNEKHFRINFAKKIPPSKLFIRAAYFSSESQFTQDAPALSPIGMHGTTSLTGSIAKYEAEYFPGSWGYQKSVNLVLKQSSLQGEGRSLQESKFGGEFGWILKNTPVSTHNFYVGNFFSKMDSANPGNITGTYGFSFLTTRYQYLRALSDQLSWGVDAGLQLSINKELSPSYLIVPSIRYQLTETLRVNLELLYEKYTAVLALKDNAEADKIGLTLANTAVGLNLTWQLF
jgi:hypothetical protein